MHFVVNLGKNMQEILLLGTGWKSTVLINLVHCQSTVSRHAQEQQSADLFAPSGSDSGEASNFCKRCSCLLQDMGDIIYSLNSQSISVCLIDT